MYFDFEDHRPETPILERPLTRLEQILLTIIGYLLIVIAVITYPRLPWVKAMEAARLKQAEEQRLKQDDLQAHMQYVFAAPAPVDKTPPKRFNLSDETHHAQTLEKPPQPKNEMPFSRGNSPDPISEAPKTAAAESSAPPPSTPNALALPKSPDATIARNEPSSNPTIRNPSTGLISDAIRNVQKYTNGEQLQNVQGNGDFGPSFQFDSKGVDFGSWLRRFRAQVYRNWLIPYAAMALHGHVILTFNIHKDGTVTDLQILQPSSIDAFTKAAFNAIKSSNPTVPLPTEYPDDQMRMTVVFYYNETPPGGGGQ